MTIELKHLTEEEFMDAQCADGMVSMLGILMLVLAGRQEDILLSIKVRLRQMQTIALHNFQFGLSRGFYV